MIYEYAVDPSTFVSKDKMLFILESFGRDKGRLISEVKKEHWVRFVREACRKIYKNKPIARARLKEALKILVKDQKALYNRQVQVQGNDWLSITKRAHSDWPYRGILVENPDEDRDYFLVRDIHLASKPEWNVPTSITVERKAETIVDAFRPMLEIAREVILVDRNFRTEDQHGNTVKRFLNVLQGILKFVANKPYGPWIGKITYHIGDQYYDENNLQDLQAKLRNFFKDSFPAGIKLEFAIWPKYELHDRFILTDIGGVDCGIGLDEFSGTSEKTVTLKRLSHLDHSREWAKFKQKTADVIFPAN